MSRVVAVDVGGTFTDCVAWTDGRLSVVKVPTTPSQESGVVEGSMRLLGGRAGDQLVHGTTAATNALLERKGAQTALVTDAGFEDVIEIGRQDRPSLYDPFQDRSDPLVERSRRVGFEGDVGAIARRMLELAPESIAICLGYSYLDPAQEKAIAAALDGPVSVSHLVSPEFREFERTSTTVLNAYLQPVVSNYLSRLESEAQSIARRLWVMRSSGGLLAPREAADLAAALLLSGPAGGVVAAGQMGARHGYDRVISFDMGGTSTDVCRIENGVPEIAYEREVEGYVCRLPSVGVHTVGAGGGSIAWVDAGGSLRVGPVSAGAEPGPAAYGRGGSEATVTDAHVVLGRLGGDIALGGELELVASAARTAVEKLGNRVGLTVMETARGIVEVVEAHMERAIRAVSVEQGADPRDAVLVAFGGAGGLHASALARRLGMRAAAIPPMGGVFSAVGLLMTPPRVDVARSVDPNRSDALGLVGALRAEAAERFEADHGTSPSRVSSSADLRYAGQAHEINVAVSPDETAGAVADRFHDAHAERNGFARTDDRVEIVTLRAVAEGSPHISWADLAGVEEGPMPKPQPGRLWVDGEPCDAPIWLRSSLPAGAELAGPCLIVEEVGTTYLAPGERAGVLDDGTIEVTW